MATALFLQPVPWLSKMTEPVAEYFSLPTLSLHIHQVLAAALFYGVIYYPLSPILSRLLFPNHYLRLSRSRRLNWDAHVVSLIQSVSINAMALWVFYADDERRAMSREERIWGYTHLSASLQGFFTGYFVWDLVVTCRNFSTFGPGALAHAISALLVYSLGYRPFGNYYACIFALWELSTPFLNIHWFLDKLDMTGSPIQLYNGIALITTFFFCRLVYGTYHSYYIMRDVWLAVDTHPSVFQLAKPTMAFVSPSSTVPLWLALCYLMCNITLNSLNMYWFVKMIQAVAKRFTPAKQPPPTVKIPTLGFSTSSTSHAKETLQKRIPFSGNEDDVMDVML